MIGVRVRVHPHGTPLEREGVRRSNAKNESGLLPKFQNDLSVSSYCVMRALALLRLLRLGIIGRRRRERRCE